MIKNSLVDTQDADSSVLNGKSSTNDRQSLLMDDRLKTKDLTAFVSSDDND